MLLMKGRKTESKSENNQQPDSVKASRGHELGTMAVPKAGNYLNQVGGDEETGERFFELDLKDGVKSYKDFNRCSWCWGKAFQTKVTSKSHGSVSG